MKKENRLKKNSDFQHVFKRGTSVANRQFVIYFLKKDKQTTVRVGISVSKKNGNAVTRNRIKRYIKEAIRDMLPRLAASHDIVIIARKPVSTMELYEFKKSLNHVLKLSGLLKK